MRKPSTTKLNLRYDVLVVDLDGTLLRRDGSVSEADRRAICRARDSGMEIIVATGRSLKESRGAIEAIGHAGLVVAAGGSMMCEAASGRTVDRRVLGSDVVADAARPLLDAGHRVLILKDAHAAGMDYVAVGDGALDPASQWWFNHLGVEVRHIDDLADDPNPDDTVRAGAVACESRLAPLARRLKEHMGDRCSLQHWSAVTASHAVGSTTHLLEIFMTDVNKWTMIQAHCTRSGIDPARVAAIGDGLNDVELIANAGVGIAMGNSCAEVASVADRTTTDHEHDGVAAAIECLISGEW